MKFKKLTALDKNGETHGIYFNMDCIKAIVPSSETDVIEKSEKGYTCLIPVEGGQYYVKETPEQILGFINETAKGIKPLKTYEGSYCRICNEQLHSLPNFCPNCGQRLKWSE